MTLSMQVVFSVAARLYGHATERIKGLVTRQGGCSLPSRFAARVPRGSGRLTNDRYDSFDTHGLYSSCCLTNETIRVLFRQQLMLLEVRFEHRERVGRVW
jgi:hypothetical protein